MFRLARMASVAIDLACKVFPSPIVGRVRRSRLRKRKSARQHWVRLELEPLEERALLSASIFGNVWNDLIGNGLRQAGDPGVAGLTLFLDQNGNHTLDTSVTTVIAPSTAINGAPGLLGADTGFVASTLEATGLPSKLVDLAVTMDLTNNTLNPVTVAVVSPLGLTVPNLPNLFNIQPGEHFVGTFDGNSTNAYLPSQSVGAAPTTGTFRPEVYFTDPQAHIYDGDPNGTWGLVFFASDSTGLDLKSWSLSFTTSEPTTQTAANGNYSFTGLQPGIYHVTPALHPGDVATSPASGEQDVALSANQTVTGVDFGIKPAPAPAPGAALIDVPVNTGPGVQNSPSIAVDPHDPNHLVVAYMDYSVISTGFAGIGIGVSKDGGKTWSNSSIPLPAGYTQGVADPKANFDSQGHVFVSFMAATFLAGSLPNETDPAGSQRHLGFEANDGIFVAEGDVQADGSVTWNAPVAVAAHLSTGADAPFDVMPQSAVDNAGNVYVTWARFYPAGQFPGSDPNINNSDVMIAVSADGGQTWTTRLQSQGGLMVSAIRDPQEASVDAGSAGRGNVAFPNISVGPAGDIYVSTFSGGNFAVFHSTDGGKTFVAPNYDPNNSLGLPFFQQSAAAYPKFGTVSPDNFRTTAVRDIVADPSHPGRVYVAEAMSISNPPLTNNFVDTADIIFARSDDYGLTWQHLFTVGPDASYLDSLTPVQRDNTLPVLNDDNGGRFIGFDAQTFNDVVSGQAKPAMSVDAQGNLTVIWYDSRRDPAGNTGNPGGLLDVFGTVSTDGGLTFNANFRITDTATPFDPNAGVFTNANGRSDFFFGDAIGVVAVNGTADAVWTDARSGNQDIYFSHYTLTPAPAPPAGDRFSPNNTLQTATPLGPVSAQQVYPRLGLVAGSSDEWFSLQAGATGELIVSATATGPGGTLDLVITDAAGNVIPGSASNILDASGAVVGEAVTIPSVAGTNYLVHVHGVSSVGISYTLVVSALTADLGTLVASTKADTVAAGGQNVYRLEAGIQGTLQVAFTASNVQGSGLNVQIVAADGQTVLAGNVVAVTSASPNVQLRLPVTQGQILLVKVSAVDGSSSGDFTLNFTDVDQYETSGARGTQIEGSISDARVAGPNLPNKDYPVTAAVGGTLQVNISASGGFSGTLKVRVLNADKTLRVSSVFVPSGGSAQLLVPSVAQGETVFVRVSGVGLNSGDNADYTLHLSNLDQAASSGISTLFFPTSGDPKTIVSADLTGTGRADLVVTNTNASDTLGVLASNGDGTFQAERQFDVGPGLDGGILAGNRQVSLVDVNGDGILDAVVPNFRAGSISVLLGNGDGTFQPQRIFNALPGPDSLVTGAFSGDGKTDVVVLQNFGQGSAGSSFTFLKGHGDGTFAAPTKTYSTVFPRGATSMVAGDFNGDGKLDVIVFSFNDSHGQLFLGNGDGTFKDAGTFTIPEATYDVKVVDLNGDGKLDLVTTSTNSGKVYVMLGNGNGTFQAPLAYLALAPTGGGNINVKGLAIVNFDGHQDIVVTASQSTGGAAQVILLPGLVDSNGGFAGFGSAQVLATVGVAGKVVSGDFNGDGATDIAVADKGGVTVIYGKPLTLSASAPHNLGSVAHLQTLPRAIVTGNQDAFYTYTAPTEAAPGSGDEVIDFSANFQYVGGAGLQLVVSDGNHILDSGSRFRVTVHQGEVLTAHVFGFPGTGGTAPGFGAYTLNIDVLPQVISVQAQSALPGAPANTLVVTLQGDRLDPATAENPANYTVTWFGPDGKQGTADDQVIPVAASGGGQSVVYDPGANVAVANGLTYPTAVRQTITLLFASALPAGSYEVKLASDIKTAPFSADEAGMLAGDSSFAGHPLVSARNGIIENGSSLIVANLVAPAGKPNPDAIVNGTPSLTQLTNDLTAMLDAQLKLHGDDPAITAQINNQIIARFSSLMGSGVSVAIVWLDPVSLDLQAPQGGERASYSLKTNKEANSLTRSYVEVGGNVEVIVMAGVAGTFKLDVGDVPQTARGGAVVFDPTGSVVLAFTSELRAGTTEFLLQIADVATDVGASVAPRSDVLAQTAAAIVLATTLGDFTGATTELIAFDGAAAIGAAGSLPAQAVAPNAPTVVDDDPADKKVDDKQDKKVDDKQDKNANDKQDDKNRDKIDDKQGKKIDDKQDKKIADNQEKQDKKAADKQDDKQDEEEDVKQVALSRDGREALDLALCLFADSDDGLIGVSQPSFSFDARSLASVVLSGPAPSAAVADMTLVGEESFSRHSSALLSAEPRASEADGCWLALFLVVGAYPDAFGATKPDDGSRRKPRNIKRITGL